MVDRDSDNLKLGNFLFKGITGLWVSMFLSAVLPMTLGFILAESFSDWRWSHYPFHSMLESTGALSALIIAALMVVMLKRQHLSRRYIWAACALLGMGLFDGFHAVLHVGVTFVWLHSIATMVGGVLFALVWLPDTWLTETRQRLLLIATVIASLVANIVSTVQPDILPVMVVDGQFSIMARIINISGGAGFLIGASFFIYDYWRKQKIKSSEFYSLEDMVFANHCMLFGIAGLLFETSVLWDAGWWWWHILRLMAYLVVLIFFFSVFNKGQDILSKNEEKLRLINSRIPGILYQFKIDSNGKKSLPYVGPTIENFIGLSPEAAMDDVGKLFALTHPNDFSGLEASIAESMKSMTLWEWEGRFVRDNGELIWLRGASTPARLDDGSVLWDGLFVDITEQKKAEAELLEYKNHLEELVHERTLEMGHALNEAERANLAKSEFLSRMSHELRTPMNAILGFGQLLQERADGLNEIQRGNVKEILDAGYHLLDLINEILDLAKIESGKMEISIEDVLLDDVLQQCIVLIRPQLEKHHLELIDNISNKNGIIKADFTRLKQVLLNLLSNAIKYGREHGRILLNSEVIDKHRMRISVTDSGKGISKDDINKLFVPFERLNENTNVEGTGIGLVISKNLVELMNGKIGVESTPGESATFWLEFELSDSV